MEIKFGGKDIFTKDSAHTPNKKTKFDSDELIGKVKAIMDEYGIEWLEVRK